MGWIVNKVAFFLTNLGFSFRSNEPLKLFWVSKLPVMNHLYESQINWSTTLKANIDNKYIKCLT